MGHLTKRQLVIYLKQEGSENDFQNLLSSKQCWNSGSTLDKSTLCQGWGGGGGKKDHNYVGKSAKCPKTFNQDCSNQGSKKSCSVYPKQVDSPSGQVTFHSDLLA